jgi:catechol 2,3-dioxygenase-like lactoylglutathione lyase family enzyme
VVETALYVADLDRACAFYARLFRLPVLVRDDRFCAFDVGGRSVLLLFLKRGTLNPIPTPGGSIPPHGGDGQLHLAFAIDRVDLERWERQLTAEGVPVESSVTWPRGGVSLYFRDPDGHLVELATPGLWAMY